MMLSGVKGFSRSFLLALAAGLLVARAAAANTITVNSALDTTADDGFCTLREAIIAANTNTASGAMPGECAAGAAGADTIVFAISGAGVHTIQPTSQLPATTEPVTIDGFSQGVAAANTLAVGNNAVLLIEIDGINAPNINGGLLKIGGGNSTVKGLVINRGQGNGSFGLELASAGNTVVGNFIGSDTTGTLARGSGCQAVQVGGGNNTIGGTGLGDRNLISGGGATSCGVNMDLESNNNHVLNNYLGTNAAGTAALGGGRGVTIGNGKTGNIIGGTTVAERNVISGNSNAGVQMFGNVSANLVQGNFIGTDASGTSAVPNGKGVQITEASHNNSIGGTAAGAGNRIAFNSGNGVDFPSFVGSTGNAILGNSIFSNGGLGIDLKDDGLTANDDCDADTGPNNLQNFPVITSVTAGAGSTTVQGTLNAVASRTYRIEIFANEVCEPSGYGEGKTYLGSTVALTDVSCNGSFNVTLPVSVAPTALLTATATDENNNTSEFSACVGVQTTFFTVTPCRVADTRDAPGPSGGPALTANTVRTFPVAGLCGIPASASAVAINLAVVGPSIDGDLRVYPAGGAAPLASAINFRTGIVRANNAIVPLGTGGQISVQCDMPSGSTHFFFDVYGYFQ